MPYAFTKSSRRVNTHLPDTNMHIHTVSVLHSNRVPALSCFKLLNYDTRQLLALLICICVSIQLDSYPLTSLAALSGQWQSTIPGVAHSRSVLSRASNSTDPICPQEVERLGGSRCRRFSLFSFSSFFPQTVWCYFQHSRTGDGRLALGASSAYKGARLVGVRKLNGFFRARPTGGCPGTDISWTRDCYDAAVARNVFSVGVAEGGTLERRVSTEYTLTKSKSCCSVSGVGVIKMAGVTTATVHSMILRREVPWLLSLLHSTSPQRGSCSKPLGGGQELQPEAAMSRKKLVCDDHPPTASTINHTQKTPSTYDQGGRRRVYRHSTLGVLLKNVLLVHAFSCAFSS
ncbi:hypothetical protein V8C35DRAFT_161232 [Trichoderma chlorosporum]